MNSFTPTTDVAAGRSGMHGLRAALGPGFAMVAPSEATLLVATGHLRARGGRPVHQ